MLNVVNKSIMLCVIMLSVFMLNVVMLSVVTAKRVWSCLNLTSMLERNKLACFYTEKQYTATQVYLITLIWYSGAKVTKLFVAVIYEFS